MTACIGDRAFITLLGGAVAWRSRHTRRALSSDGHTGDQGVQQETRTIPINRRPLGNLAERPLG